MAAPTAISICSGVGMLDLGLRLAVDARTVLYVEREIPAVEVLVSRFADGTLHDAPIWSDVTTLDARPWRGVDILAGGIPCQPFSLAGGRAGNADERALAPHVLRLASECKPSVVFIENVPPWVLAGHAREFIGGLQDMGYGVAPPLFVRASDFGASHRRERVFVMAYRESCDRSLFVQPGGPDEAGRQSDRSGGEVAESPGDRWRERRTKSARIEGGSDVAERGSTMADSSIVGHERPRGALDGRRGSSDDCGELGDAERTRRWWPAIVVGRDGGWAHPVSRPSEPSDHMGDSCRPRLEDGRPDAEPRAFPAAWPPGPSGDWSDIDPELWPATTEPLVRGVAHGRAARVDRLRALGNGVVPVVVAYAFRALWRRLI